MPEFIRVKNKHTGSEFTLPSAVALGDDLQVIKKDAVHPRTGKPLPPTHKSNATNVPDSRDSEPTKAAEKSADNNTSKE